MHKSFPRHATVQLHTFRLDTPNRLVLRWRNEFIPAMAADGDSRCTFTLEPEGDAVRLTKILSSLKSLLETGDALEATKYWPKGM